MSDDNDERQPADEHTIIRGILFRCTIRGGHASLAIVVTSFRDITIHYPSTSAGDNSGGGERVVLVVVQFGGSEWQRSDDSSDNNSNTPRSEVLTLMRSNIRRMCKLGNQMEFRGSFAVSQKNDKANHNWDRFMVDYYLPSLDDAVDSIPTNIRVVQVQRWDATRCQLMRGKYFPQPPQKQPSKSRQNKKKDQNQFTTTSNHGGGVGKRKQGEVVADFLLWMLSSMNNASTNADDTKRTNYDAFDKANGVKQHQHERYLFMERWVSMDNMISANTNSKDDVSSKSVVDAAGGAGHVSLALALRNVKSTVVDPRPSVGRLPGRDRKVLKKSKASFFTYRAWFGSRPNGIDTFFREGCTDYFTNQIAQDGHKDADQNDVVTDPTTLPICSMCSEDKLLPNCTAIVALHPDEATGVIVQTAVEHQIPFVVVPCCVFSKLFPERIKPLVEGREGTSGLDGNGLVVSTYYDLIDWLVAKHPSIRVSRLPFDGANLAVWSTFQSNDV